MFAFRKVIRVLRPFLFYSLGVSRKTVVKKDSTALVHFAASIGTVHVLNYLLERAALRNNTKMISVLLLEGADVNVNYSNPLRIALSYGRVNTITRLLAAGADVNLKVDNQSPFEIAVMYLPCSYVETLLAAGGHSDDAVGRAHMSPIESEKKVRLLCSTIKKR